MCIKEKFVINREKFIHFFYFTWNSRAHTEQTISTEHINMTMAHALCSMEIQFVRGIQIAANQNIHTYIHRNKTKPKQKKIENKWKKWVKKRNQRICHWNCSFKCSLWISFFIEISQPFHTIILHTRMREHNRIIFVFDF